MYQVAPVLRESAHVNIEKRGVRKNPDATKVRDLKPRRSSFTVQREERHFAAGQEELQQHLEEQRQCQVPVTKPFSIPNP